MYGCDICLYSVQSYKTRWYVLDTVGLYSRQLFAHISIVITQSTLIILFVILCCCFSWFLYCWNNEATHLHTHRHTTRRAVQNQKVFRFNIFDFCNSISIVSFFFFWTFINIFQHIENNYYQIWLNWADTRNNCFGNIQRHFEWNIRKIHIIYNWRHVIEQHYYYL